MDALDGIRSIPWNYPRPCRSPGRRRALGAKRDAVSGQRVMVLAADYDREVFAVHGVSGALGEVM